MHNRAPKPDKPLAELRQRQATLRSQLNAITKIIRARESILANGKPRLTPKGRNRSHQDASEASPDTLPPTFGRIRLRHGTPRAGPRGDKAAMDPYRQDFGF
jgi:hypothetical protein